MSTDNLVENIIAEVLGKVGDLKTPSAASQPVISQQEPAIPRKLCGLTEFVGTAMGDSIGLVIANVDSALLDAMHLEKKYRSIGILGARTGAGPQIMAADEAVKATNTEVVAIELARDTKGGAGHGSLVLFGGQDVSDVKRAVEVALERHLALAGLVEFAGVAVAGVVRGGPAHAGGMEPGDILTAINGEAIVDAPAAINRIAALKPGTEMRAIVMRQNREVELKLRIGERPAESGTPGR